MTFAFALVAAALFGAGAYLILKTDLFRVVAGIVLISNTAILTLIASGLSRGRAPIHPLPESVSDPLVQALAVTALVIGFATTGLLLALVYRVYTSLESVDLDELSHAEAQHEQELERERIAV